MSAKPAKKKRKARYKRKNPLKLLPGLDSVKFYTGRDTDATVLGDYIAGMAGTLAITAAVSSCTTNEKLLIAGLIPTFLKIVRSVPKKDVDGALEKMYPPPVEEVPEA